MDRTNSDSEASARGYVPWAAHYNFHMWLWFQAWRPDTVGDLARAQNYGIPYPDPIPSQEAANQVYDRAVREYTAFCKKVNPKSLEPNGGGDAQDP